IRDDLVTGVQTCALPILVMTPFYAVLEARRQTQTATSVGSVLLSATAAIADGNQSLAARFAREHGVSLRLFPAGQGPRDSSVFEIGRASCRGRVARRVRG